MQRFIEITIHLSVTIIEKTRQTVWIHCCIYWQWNRTITYIMVHINFIFKIVNWVMVYDLHNNDIYIWIVCVPCVIAPCCGFVHFPAWDLQGFLCRWFAWSSTLLLSRSFPQRVVVKSVPTSHLDWLNEPPMKPDKSNSAAEIMFLM